MKQTFTLIFSLITLAMGAQITYKQQDGPRVGTKATMSVLDDISGYDLGDYTSPGGNQTWQITGSSSDNAPVEYISVDGLSFKTMFPGSNMAAIQDLNVDSSYIMHKTNSSGFYLIGLYSPGTPIVFNKDVLLTPYPLVYNDNFQNDVEAIIEVSGFPAKFSLLTNSVVDGWGMMTTDKGSFPSLKMKTVQLIEITIMGIPIGNQTLISHSWLASGYGNPVAVLEFIEQEDGAGGLSNDTAFSYLVEQEIVANSDFTQKNNKLKLLPNPVQDDLQIELIDVPFNQAVYNIVNSEGKTIMNGEFNSNAPMVLNVQNLPAGNYLVQLILDKDQMFFDIMSKL